ncbi:MAG TPA: M17 family peptidase N-terminal domain-containing protein, partial [Acidimicrobiales bacterium]
MPKSVASPWWGDGGTPLPAASVAVEVPADAEVLGVPVLSGPDGAVVAGEALVELDLVWLAGRGFEGKPGDLQVVPADDGSVVVAVGVGEAGTVDRERWRKAGAATVRAGGTARRLAFAIPLSLLGAKGEGAAAAAQAVVEGAAL